MVRIRFKIGWLCVLCMFSTFVVASTIDTAQWINRIDSAIDLADRYEQEYHAVQLAKQSMQLKGMYYGENSEQYIMSVLKLSEIYSQRGIIGKSNRYHAMAYEPYMEILRSTFCGLSERQKYMYWQKALPYFAKTVSIAYNQSLHTGLSDVSEMAASAYNAQLLSKGLMLNLTMDLERYVKRSNNAQAQHLLAQRKMMVHSSDLAALDSLDRQILAALNNADQPYHIDQLSLTWQQVQQHLEKEDLAIEFFRTDMNQYGALLLKAGWKSPIVLVLPQTYKVGGKQKYDLCQMVELDRKDSQAHQGYSQWTKAVASMIWSDKMLQYFPYPGEGKVYFSADGILLQMAIEHLPFVNYTDTLTGNIETAVMSDVFDMVRVSSTRELVDFNRDRSNLTAVLYGNIDYNMTIEGCQMQSEMYEHMPMTNTRVNVLQRGQLKNLYWTQLEVDSINRVLSDNHIKPKTYAEQQASEESFKALSGKQNSILHVATHGFMWKGRTDPMDRCGLYMAGANNALLGHSDQLPKQVQDGILTAKEISQLDLSGCNLAVLSACETAQGLVTSEGVFGLQRAFKMAGVKTIIMSLWPIDDQSTQILMSTFYNNWIVCGQSIRKAFDNAKQTLRHFSDKNGNLIYSNPYYWAGFIMMD